MNSIIEKLAERITLCEFNRGMWCPRRVHHKETAAENRRHNTNVVSVSVMLTEHPALVGVKGPKGETVKRGLKSVHSESYREHIRITLPSCADGWRVLPGTRRLEHAGMIQSFKTEHDALVAEFLAAYPQERSSAVARLNGLYDADMWPNEGKLPERFYFRSRYLPCPTDAQWGEWLTESAEIGKAELQDRLVNAARHLAEMCDGDHRLFQATFDNLKDVCELADDLNLLDDPIIAGLAKNLKPVAEKCAEALADDKKGRKAVATEAINILAGLKL